jgi:hypothetical protein
MFTAISAIVGLLGSVLPSVVRIFERKTEVKYELELQKLRNEAAKEGLVLQKDIADIQADVAEGQHLYSYDDISTDYKFIKGLRASVRPVITYTLFILFVVVKSAAAYVMLKNGVDIPTMIQAIWDTETMSLFATVIAFWFGTRAYEKSKRYAYNVTKATPVDNTKTKGK